MNSTQDNPFPTCTLPCDAKLIDGEAGCATANDDNRCVVDGVAYVAVDAVLHDSSKRCATTCDAYAVCYEAGSCVEEFRKDKRNIVWKRLTKEIER